MDRKIWGSWKKVSKPGSHVNRAGWIHSKRMRPTLPKAYEFSIYIDNLEKSSR